MPIAPTPQLWQPEISPQWPNDCRVVRLLLVEGLCYHLQPRALRPEMLCQWVWEEGLDLDVNKHTRWSRCRECSLKTLLYEVMLSNPTDSAGKSRKAYVPGYQQYEETGFPRAVAGRHQELSVGPRQEKGAWRPRGRPFSLTLQAPGRQLSLMASSSLKGWGYLLLQNSGIKLMVRMWPQPRLRITNRTKNGHRYCTFQY